MLERSFRSPTFNGQRFSSSPTLFYTGSLSFPCAVVLNPSTGVPGCPRDAGAASPGWKHTVGVCAEEVTGPREGSTAQPGLVLELKSTSLLGPSYY